MNTELARQNKRQSLWVENDRTEWSEEAFASIPVLLTDRAAAIPIQKNIDANGAKGVAPEKKGSNIMELEK